MYIIDDDEVYIFTTRRMLELGGYDVDILSFTSAQLAIEDLRNRINNQSTLPDVIFLDINMPDMNGWDFLDQVMLLETFESDLNKVDIFIVSSSTDRQDQIKSSSYDIVADYVIKPFSFEVLDSCINP